MARLGGDEFVVLAMEAEGFDTQVRAHRLVQAIDTANAASNRPFTISLSIGIARFDPQSPRNLDSLLAESDSLMYENKQKKKMKS